MITGKVSLFNVLILSLPSLTSCTCAQNRYVSAELGSIWRNQLTQKHIIIITAFQLTSPHGSLKWISEQRQFGIAEIWDAPRKKQKRGNDLEVEQRWFSTLTVVHISLISSYLSWRFVCSKRTSMHLKEQSYCFQSLFTFLF